MTLSPLVVRDAELRKISKITCAKRAERRVNMNRLREITEEEIEQALRHPGSFGYSGDRDMFNTWSLGPMLETRDSGMIAKSNAHAMTTELQRLEEAGEIEPDSWEVISCGHWGCGWVEQLTFQAIDDDGEPTRVFSHIMEMVDCINEHVVLDSSDHSEREYAAQLESIENNAPGLRDGLPKDWQDQVFGWLWANQQNEAFDGDDRTYVPESCVSDACEALGFVEEEEE
jgi:hypothetical protein